MSDDYIEPSSDSFWEVSYFFFLNILTKLKINLTFF
jgi:hypothetical protein